jgi:RNA recognition motif-containing protein
VNGKICCYTEQCLTGAFSRAETSDPLFSEFPYRMSFTVFLGNLPAWVTADDIQSWLNAEALVADSIKVIRNPETQESKGFAFIEAPNAEEMQSIIRRFDRAPLEDKLLRANPAQPPKGKGAPRPEGSRPPGEGRPEFRTDRRPRTDSRPPSDRGPRPQGERPQGDRPVAAASGSDADRNKRRSNRPSNTGTSAFAEELAKAL